MRYHGLVATILRFAGLRVVIYTNDHRPAHVHVIGKGHEAIFWLNCPNGPVHLRENYGFLLKELTRIESSLSRHVAQLCLAWENIHGIA